MNIINHSKGLLLLFLLLFWLQACDKAQNNNTGKSATQINKKTVYQKKFPLASVSMDLVKVSEHVYYVRGKAGIATENEGFVSNAGVILTSQGIVLVDALGTPALAELLLEKIAQISDLPVKKVIVTHYHADHVYGLQIFKDLGAEIIAPIGSYDYIDSSTATDRLEERRFSLDPWVNDNTHLVPPDKIIDSETHFSLGGIEFVLSVLGKAHSDGDLTVYVKNDRVLLSGDIIFEGRVPYLGDSDTKTWLETLGKLETSQLAALIPGHGAMASNPNQALKETRRYLFFMRDKMGQAVRDFVSFEEVYSATDWSEFNKLPAFDAANRRNAFQVYLSMETELLEGG
ncbi:MAG TPA: MBL fold metallo-hydrolase [Gammaproteobacteria bacterium]|mgnify:CR=1 FL=1|nr:MBL fold metallo-hydrolase [Gammaproteobacteria bacterium]